MLKRYLAELIMTEHSDNLNRTIDFSVRILVASNQQAQPNPMVDGSGLMVTVDLESTLSRHSQIGIPENRIT